MKILIFGATGFIGSALSRELAHNHEVYKTTRNREEVSTTTLFVDLLDKTTISSALTEAHPDIVINCAGIVDASKDVTLNERYTRTILQAIVDSGIQLQRIIITGSSAEYGEVGPAVDTVSETQPFNANSPYGQAKVSEEQTADRYRTEYNLPVVVVRVFNPIGLPMAEKFFTTRLKRQIEEYIEGQRTTLEVSRLDSQRDYVAVSDVAAAYKAIIEGTPQHTVYNVGSGIATTNEELLTLMMERSKIEDRPNIVETLATPEPVYAHKADISRLRDDFGWEPKKTVGEAVREIMYDQQT